MLSRGALRALVGHAIAAFGVLQIVEPVIHGLHWPDAVLGSVVALAAGIPLVVALAWVFDVEVDVIAEEAAQHLLCAVAAADHAVAVAPATLASRIWKIHRSGQVQKKTHWPMEPDSAQTTSRRLWRASHNRGYVEPRIMSSVGELLDRADALDRGRGRVDLFGTVLPDFIGGGLSYQHRLSPSASAIAQGWAGWGSRVGGWRPDYGAVAGVRWAW